MTPIALDFEAFSSAHGRASVDLPPADALLPLSAPQSHLLTDENFSPVHWDLARILLCHQLEVATDVFMPVFATNYALHEFALPDSSIERRFEILHGLETGTERERCFLCHVGKTVYLTTLAPRQRIALSLSRSQYQFGSG